MAERWGSHEFTARNPKPARGPDILTLTQLRHYARLFWHDRRYGICGLRGGKAAFYRFLGLEDRSTFERRILNCETEYLPAPLQVLWSRKFLQIVRGEVIFVEVDGNIATHKPMLGSPEPPVAEDIRPPDHQFRWEWTPTGPKVRRL